MLIKRIKEIEPKLIEYRRHFHKYPELTGEEYETLEYIKTELMRHDIRFVEIKDGGILGFIGDKARGKTILLRGDMDALPILESQLNLKKEKIVVSKNPGVCHACGHDGHTAMLLAAAMVLKDIEEQLDGRVILCFERGEEGASLAKNIISYIKNSEIEVDLCYGMHLRNCLEAGKMSANPGPIMAGILVFDVTIIGQGGHGSRPDLSVSPIDCFSKIYLELNAARMKRVSPFEPLIFSIGKLDSGSRKNVIPDTLTFGGSVRYFNTDVGKQFRKELIDIISNVSKECKCNIKYNQLSDVFPCVYNDEHYSQVVQNIIKKYVGESNLVEDEEWMGSETFSLYRELAPCVFTFLGIYNEELGTGANHHTPEFDIDESVLINGVASHVGLAYEFLESKEV